MKLVNFASLDPAHQARGISGLKGVSKADRQVWDEFHSNWLTLATVSENRLNELLAARPPAKQLERSLPLFWSPPMRPTEAMASVRVRTMQGFFRKVVLAAYGWRCAVTGNPVPELLIASHILPWSQFPEHRLNPQNGLCLAAHFDRAFDQGLITFGNNMKLVISSELRAYLPEEAIEREFLSTDGTPLRTPERFRPNVEFLDYHRRNIFRP
jgi:putative restriction endonuclease